MHSVFPAQRRSNCGCADGGSVSATQAVADAGRLAKAVGALQLHSPEHSAASGLWTWQRRALALSVAFLGIGVALAPEATLIGLLAVMAMPFLCVVVLRTVALWQLAHPLPKPSPPAAASQAPLPVYTVLVPLFREAGVVGDLLSSLRALDYPAARLEVMLIVEAVDGETRAALAHTYRADKFSI